MIHMSIVKVAKLAGCSHTTVSRVINQHPGVSAGAASRVQAAMRKLNYVPPVKRRGPRPKSRPIARTGNIALLMFGTEATELVAPVSSAVVHAAQGALSDRGFSMTLSQVRDDTRLPAVVTRGEVDGLLLHGMPPSTEMANRLRRTPAVWLMSPRSEAGYWGDRVAPDNGAIGKMAADYLIDRGHARIAFLYVDATHRGFSERAAAFEYAAGSVGVACDVIRGDTSPDAGDFRAQRELINQLIDRFVALPDRPTGLFVPRGQTTLMVFEALRSRGMEPGRGVTVIACDNDPALAGLDPQIATIDVRPDRVGRRAVEQLMASIEKRDVHGRSTICIEPTLVTPDIENR